MHARLSRLLFLAASLWLGPVALRAQGTDTISPGRERGRDVEPEAGAAGAAPRVAGEGARTVRLVVAGTPESVTVGGTEIHALADKLAAFGNSLTPDERLMMDWLLQRAGSAPPDEPAGIEVNGTLFTPPRIVAGSLPPGPSAADTARAAGGEATVAISPAPPAALARALGLNLLEMEGPPGAPARPSGAPVGAAGDENGGGQPSR
jgi:hypothetical protein